MWEGSLEGTAVHVIGPMLSIGLLCGAMRCGPSAAAMLPLVVRGSNAILDTLAAVVWSTVLLAATPYFDAGLSSGATLPQPRGAVLGAISEPPSRSPQRALRGPIYVRHP